MKKILLFLTLVASLPIFSQAITVNTTTYTVPQLVTDVLVNKPCVVIPPASITWRTGTDFGSTNGIGYFENTNPAFPLQSGVILTTGNVLNAPGPNNTQLDDGNAAWTGDAQLEATLLAAGITMNSTNATVLEFDFVPFSPNFNFEFLFASEEYGTFQCQFSDAFAFLLTDTSTGITTNIAVVPNTTTPISVETIRNSLYHSGCSSANPQYFGSFNGGSSAATSATNYNGQTVLMNASSVLTPNVTYHIKLVIADRQDFEADSAIFLGANSFNIGQDVLGQDLSIANSTAICDGGSQTITSGLDPSVFSFEWTLNGNPIGGNTPDLTVNQAGTYGLTYTIIASNCVVTTDFLNVEYYSPIVTPDPVDLSLCDSAQPSYTYDLTLNTPIVGIPNTIVSYHATQSDADNNIPLPSTNYTAATASLPRTVFVRIQNANNACYITKSFQLLLAPPPVPQTTWNYRLCEETSGSGTASFNLPSQNTIALNGSSSATFSVSYYTDATNAGNGTNPIDTTVPYVSGNTVIYVRVQNNTDPNCTSISNLNLVVIPTPNVPDIPDQYVCASYTLPSLLPSLANYYTGQNGTGTMYPPGHVVSADELIFVYYTTGTTPSCFAETSFNVTIVDITEISPASGTYCDEYIIPNWMPGTTFWTNGPGGPTGGGTQIFPGTSITTNGQVIWTHFVGTETPSPCLLDDKFTVNINITPTLASVSNQFDCAAYILPPLAVGDYYTGPSGTGTLLPAGTPIITTSTIYVHADNNTCTSDALFEVFINDVTALDIDECSQYIVGTPSYGEYRSAPNGGGFVYTPGTVITTNTRIYTYVPGLAAPNCTDNDFFDVRIHQPTLVTPTDPVNCGNYLLPTNPDGARYFTLAGGPTTTGTVELFAGVDSITSTTTIYIYKDSATLLGCYNEKPWTITINQKPIIDARGNILVCTSYDLTPLVNGNYFDEPNGVNPITDLSIDLSDLNATDDLVNSAKIIYVYAAHPADPSCFTETFFRVEFDGLEADPIPNPLTYCDSFTLPPLSPNNFYYDAPGGPAGGGNIIAPGTPIVDSTLTPIYIYTETNNRLPCNDENSFMITIVDTPVLDPSLNTTVAVCDSYTLQPLTVGKYYTLSGGPNVAGGNTEIVAPVTYNLANPAPAVIYAYADSGTTNPTCSTEKAISITIFNVTELANVTNCQSYTLPTLPAGQGYYLQQNGVSPLPSNVISVTQPTIYIFGYSGYTPNCSDESSFSVTIVPKPVANAVPVNLRTVCDVDGTNDGITSFNLTALNATVLGTQTGPEFTIAYYETSGNADTETAPITSTTLSLVYVRVSNTLAPGCYAQQPINIIVNKIPDPFLLPEYAICNDHETGTLQNPVVLNTGISGSNYQFSWTLEGAPTGGNTPSITANLIGTYEVTVTDLNTTCFKTISTEVVPYEPYLEIVYSDAFQLPSFITVNVLGAGSGNYEYQLDGGQFQDSNTFYDVAPGEHTISVRDKDGKCSPKPITAVIINYPKFFTPNGDGYHETWNILNLQPTNPNAPIFIFDRFGKLIKEITPTTNGWDGTFNGNPLPSTDYWFTVDYIEKGFSKTFKSHFALKR
ncbi:choice-of-anchor L domain-containing protein [Flavobacterium sp.]|uniref:T9SS type B sorting domain-containing protein n=1 Tax=Flavobacterium sp. TaxID=239 RepID=UPI00260C7192|nr:choice-of-anchor L domain-containing protein [Flavobacterium sp.]